MRQAQVQKPDAALGLKLAKVGLAVRREGEGDPVLAPGADLIGGILAADVTGIVLALVVDHGGDVLVRGFRLDDRHHLKVHKEDVVGEAPAADGRIGRPFGNGHAAALLRARAFGIAQVFRVRLPADLAKLLIDQVAGLGLGPDAPAGRFQGLFASGVGINLRRGRGGILGLFNKRLFFSLFLFGIGMDGSSGRFGHDKGPAFILPVAVGLHEPLAEAVGHLQQGLSLLDGSIVFMHGLVPDLSEGVQDV